MREGLKRYALIYRAGKSYGTHDSYESVSEAKNEAQTLISHTSISIEEFIIIDREDQYVVEVVSKAILKPTAAKVEW